MAILDAAENSARRARESRVDPAEPLREITAVSRALGQEGAVRHVRARAGATTDGTRVPGRPPGPGRGRPTAARPRAPARQGPVLPPGPPVRDTAPRPARDTGPSAHVDRRARGADTRGDRGPAGCRSPGGGECVRGVALPVFGHCSSGP
ncbi:hypothetical protein SGLAM104S_03155 [Streptomyces glaucescens]